MSRPLHVLFHCAGNSARSILAEALPVQSTGPDAPKESWEEIEPTEVSLG